MADANGSIPDFTHELSSFKLNGHTFHRRKIDARKWAETLAGVAARERVEIEKQDGSVLFAVSAEGLQELVVLGIAEEDVPTWKEMWKKHEIEFGELAGLREWMWEQMTERPFTSGTPSSDGPGESSEASSKAGSSSGAATPKV